MSPSSAASTACASCESDAELSREPAPCSEPPEETLCGAADARGAMGGGRDPRECSDAAEPLHAAGAAVAGGSCTSGSWAEAPWAE